MKDTLNLKKNSVLCGRKSRIFPGLRITLHRLVDDFVYSHHLYSWQSVHVVKRNTILISVLNATYFPVPPRTDDLDLFWIPLPWNLKTNIFSRLNSSHARIHTGFHRFTEIGQNCPIHYNKDIDTDEIIFRFARFHPWKSCSHYFILERLIWVIENL